MSFFFFLFLISRYAERLVVRGTLGQADGAKDVKLVQHSKYHEHAVPAD